MSARRLLVLLVCAALLAVPALARADGDPASDILPGNDVALPFSPPASRAAAITIQALLRRVRAHGYPMKVAVVANKAGLGAYPELFPTPQRYAKLLATEIRFAVRKPHLLVVLPTGFGQRNLGTAGANALRGVSLPHTGDPTALTRAAIVAIAHVASANGHPTAVPQVTAGARPGAQGGRSSHTWIYVGLGVLALAALALIVSGLRPTPAGPGADPARDD
jgi:hypothetical protein